MFIAQTIRFSVVAHRLGRLRRKSPAVIHELREQRLREVLRSAVTTPFFRDKYHGLDVNTVELAQIPPTTKRELMAHFDDTVTDPAIRRADVERFIKDRRNLGRFFRGRYAVSHTSGSQGQPLILVQDRRCLEVLCGIMATRASVVTKPSLKEGFRRLLDPLRQAVVTMDRGFYPSGAAFEFVPALCGRFLRMRRLSAMQPDLLDQLNAFQPHSLIAYPSTLEWLALHPQRLHLATHLRQVGSTGEALTDRARERIKQFFNVPVFDHYGIGECLFLAEGCPTDGGAHLNADWAILEVVDQDNRPVPDGTPGAKVLVTNLANTVQPIIRYEVGDVVTMATRACRCGSRLPWIERVDGRASEVFWIGDKREQMVGSLVFKHGIEYLHHLRDWQAVQVERNRVELRLEPLPGVPLEQAPAERVVVEKLAELGLPATVRVQVRVVPTLGVDPATGKFRRMISLVDPPRAA